MRICVILIFKTYSSAKIQFYFIKTNSYYGAQEFN